MGAEPGGSEGLVRPFRSQRPLRTVAGRTWVLGLSQACTSKAGRDSGGRAPHRWWDTHEQAWHEDLLSSVLEGRVMGGEAELGLVGWHQ